MSIDFNHEVWKRIAAVIEDKAKSDRNKLESPDAGVEMTNYLRGKIAAYKELLALPVINAARVIQDEPD